ncbi:uncharacterized protein BX664DRAFT_108583 [Halteromyces radiatus]|uniref:uncharacterized protein n=1 Tax=Halteromyces radiatus TaxID=101107 RepID=UPI00221E6C97|nr:uncharacterized protein BX664DRAFT_108583 [Halteromyces radiatus]KAI8093492.1 hypothetical protein BX664DRAFT_108583 [Halteromyces radiatus]
MAMSATTGSRIHMIAGTLNEKVDTDARQSLFDQYINGTISQQSSPSITSLANSPNNNTSNNNNSNSVEDNITSSDTKLTEVEILAVKEAAKQCFMSFDGKMIIESESDRLEYLQEHCHGLSPSSLSIAADYFKQELEKVRNKTKKQLLRFQNYNTEKWDQPIGRVCYLILGKSRWEKLSDREKILITGKYAFLRKHLEDLKKRNAKIKWDKLQDQFERTVNAHGPDNWDLFCGYWLSLDQERYERRKEWESSSSKAPAPATVSNPPIYSSSSLPVGDINADPTSTALLDYNDLQFLNHHHHHQQQQQQIHHLI